MHHLELYNKTISFPDNWNELTRRQLLIVSRYLFDPEKRQHIGIHLLYRLSGLRWKAFSKISAEELWIKLHDLNFLFVKNELTVNLLPSVGTWFRKFYGPREQFRNLRFGEWIFAESYFRMYEKTNDPAYLDKLIAVLYRPGRRGFNPKDPTTDGDIREKFNEHLIDRRAKQIARLNKHTKNAILLWFVGCREYLITRYPNVFSSKEGKADPSGLPRLLLELSGTKFGTDKETADTLLSTILLHIDTTIIRNRELEKQLKK